MYAATTNDGDKEMYAALLRQCEGADSGASMSGGESGSESGLSSLSSGSSVDLEIAAPGAAEGAAAAAGADIRQAQAAARHQARVQAALSAAGARLEGLSADELHALLHSGDIHQAAERLLGMRLFLGGISHSQFHTWAAATGYAINGHPPPAQL